MYMLRLQDKTPSVYCDESRDFQLLCRLYDCVYNALLYDVSTMTNILNTKECRNNMLPLLQTKLGFYTNHSMDNTSLRYILQSFPIVVKNKGSYNAIVQTLNTFLKIHNINSSVTVYYTLEEMTLYNKYVVPDNTVLIGVNTSFQDTSLLDEVFKYILPVGVGYYFYFYSDITAFDQYQIEEKAKLLFVSDNINSQVRGSVPTYSEDEKNRLIGAVDTVNIINDNYSNTAIFTSLIPTTDGTYDAGDTSLFLGEFEGEDEFSTWVATNITSPEDGNIVVYNDSEYVYDSNDWHEIIFFGNVAKCSNYSNPNAYEVVYSINGDTNIGEVPGYYMYNGASWESNTFALYVFKKGDINE